MPVNIALIFLIGGTLGWLLVKILKPEPHLEGLIIATSSAGNLRTSFAPCSSSPASITISSNPDQLEIVTLDKYVGNLGNLLLIIVPAICHEEGSPFGKHSVCSSVGLSYASFSMAVSAILHLISEDILLFFPLLNISIYDLIAIFLGLSWVASSSGLTLFN